MKMWMLAVAALFAVPAHAAEPAFPYESKKVGWTARAKLSKETRNALPLTGFLLWSSGANSPEKPVQVLLHADRSSISEMRYGKEEGDFSRLLTKNEADTVAALADALAKTTHAVKPADVPFDARVILADEEQVKDIQVYGRPSGPVGALDAYVWNLIGEAKPAIALATSEAAINSPRYRFFRENEMKVRTLAHPAGDGSNWTVTFTPARTDSDIDCQVNVKRMTAKCVDHFE